MAQSRISGTDTDENLFSQCLCQTSILQASLGASKPVLSSRYAGSSSPQTGPASPTIPTQAESWVLPISSPRLRLGVRNPLPNRSHLELHLRTPAPSTLPPALPLLHDLAPLFLTRDHRSHASGRPDMSEFEILRENSVRMLTFSRSRSRYRRRYVSLPESRPQRRHRHQRLFRS